MIASRLSQNALPAWLLAFAVALMTAWSNPALAQDDAPDREPPTAESVAERVIERIEGIVERCEERIDNFETRTLEAIADRDDEDVINRIARRGAGAISRTAAACNRSIRLSARRAYATINRLEGDPVLIDDVRAAAEAAIEEIRDARKDAVEAIQDAAGIDLD